MTDDRFHRAVQETMRERTSSDVPFESTSRYETETGEDLRGQVESGPGDVTQAPPPSGLEVVATFHDAMPTGVTVAQDGRVFVCFPRWGDDVPFTVAEIVDGKAVAYPDQDRNVPTPPPTRRTACCRCRAWSSIPRTGCGLSTPAVSSSALRLLAVRSWSRST